MRRVSKGRRNWAGEDVPHREIEKEGEGGRERREKPQLIMMMLKTVAADDVDDDVVDADAADDVDDAVQQNVFHAEAGNVFRLPAVNWQLPDSKTDRTRM